MLYAVGPLVIALAALPGASGLLGRWFSAVFEVSSWQVIGAIMFELLAKSAAAQVYSGHDSNFVALCVANLVFACAVLLIPAIAHRIVGSGFSAIGQAIQSSVGSIVSSPVAAVPGAVAAAGAAAAPYVVKGAESVAKAAVATSSPPLVSQPGVIEAMRSAPVESTGAPNARPGDGAPMVDGQPPLERASTPVAAPPQSPSAPHHQPALPNEPAAVPGRAGTRGLKGAPPRRGKQ